MSKHHGKQIEILVNAFETCFEETITEKIAPNLSLIEDLFDDKEKKEERIRKLNLTANINDSSSLSAIVKSKYFRSKYNLIQKHKNYLDPNERSKWDSYWFFISNELNRYRKKVSHNLHDELGWEDQKDILEFCRKVKKEKSDIFAERITSVLKNLEYEQDAEDESSILCNFPNPDYMQFVGRHSIFQDVKRLLLDSKTRVVNIYGAGGYGKTAFVDHLSRHLAETEKYKKIIWFSDKRVKFDTQRNKIIELSRLQTLNEFEEQPLTYDKSDLKTVLEKYNDECLIVFDNLETFKDEGEDFVNKYATSSSQFITSSRLRTDIGDQIKIPGFSPAESTQLIRNMNIRLQLEDIDNKSDKDLEKIGNLYDNSPLLIIWHLYQLEKGVAPSNLDQKQEDVLDFCFSNTLESLHDNEKKILNILKVLQRPTTALEICFLGEFSKLEAVSPILIKLSQLSIISRSKKDGSKFYLLNENIRSILRDKDLDDLYKTKLIEKKARDMHRSIAIQRSKKELEFYDDESFEINNDEDALISGQLEKIDQNYKESKKRLDRIEDSAEHDKEKSKILSKQTESIKDLIYLNNENSQLFIAAGIAANYQQDHISSVEFFEQAVEYAKTKFTRKKSYYFLARKYDFNGDYLNSLLYSKKLSEIDNSIYTKMLLISGYLGTLEVDKAFNVFKSFDVDKINKNDLSLMVMELSKCVRRFIGIENKSEEGFIGLYDEINRWLPMIARHADAAAIQTILETVSYLKFRYKIFLDNQLIDQKIDVGELEKKLLEETEAVGRKTAFSFIENFLKGKGGGKKIHTAQLRAFDSNFLKDAFESNKEINGRATGIAQNRKGAYYGWYIKFEDQSSVLIESKDIQAQSSLRTLTKNKRYKFSVIERDHERFMWKLKIHA